MINLNPYEPLSSTNCDRRAEVLFLKQVSETLTELGYKNWIDFGTLLGAYREGKVIDHDWDLDILCIEPSGGDIAPSPFIDLHNFRLLAALQEFCYVRYFRERKYLSVIPRNSKFRLNHVCIGIYKAETTWFGFREFFIDELETIRLYDIDLPCPRHLDIFIPMRYGHEWQTPIKDYVTPPGDVFIPNKKRYVCYTSMVGDFFHAGHQNLLERCRRLFDHVIVGVHNDEDVQTYKSRPYHSYAQRIERIRNSPHTSEVYENAPVITTLELVDQLKVDFVVAGREDPERMQRMYPIPSSRMHLISRTPNISSSQIRQQLTSV
jgi:cytidyltransferase-like protein